MNSVDRFIAMLMLMIYLQQAEQGNAWQKPGCHKIGHSRDIRIPECVQFRITTNACRGYCISWSVPSSRKTLVVNPAQTITSLGQCCNIMETEDVSVSVLCLDGIRNLTFKSAVSCSCYHCKKN